MPMRHELAQVAHVLVLEALLDNTAEPLPTAIQRLEDRVLTCRRHEPTFDFGYWSRGTLAEVLQFLSDCGFLELSGLPRPDLRVEAQWRALSIRRTPEGVGFAMRSRSSLSAIFESLDGKELRRTAASA